MSPRTARQFREIREEKRALIMETALEHFAEKGFSETTINHIAKRAGISKGLMYNYFESKEALLTEIIDKSVNEVYQYFDIDRDGYLSEEEFEFFIRKVSIMLKEKRSFWKLLFQLLMQYGVRERFFMEFVGSDSFLNAGQNPEPELPAARIMKMITDYFIRKKGKKGNEYDPVNEVNMFLIVLRGFAITSIYSDINQEEKNEMAISTIIQLFK